MRPRDIEIVNTKCGLCPDPIEEGQLVMHEANIGFVHSTCHVFNGYQRPILHTYTQEKTA